jgi:hypothetical protein
MIVILFIILVLLINLNRLTNEFWTDLKPIKLEIEKPYLYDLSNNNISNVNNILNKYEIYSDTKIIIDESKPSKSKKINNQDIFNNRIKFYNTNPYLEIEKKLNSNNKIDSSNCYLVSKGYNGEYYYIYEKLSNEKCNIDLYNDEIVFKKNIKNKLGSCRNANLECIDYVTKEDCKKYKSEMGRTNLLYFDKYKKIIKKNNLEWYKKPCEERIPYKPPKLKDYKLEIQ